MNNGEKRNSGGKRNLSEMESTNNVESDYDKNQLSRQPTGYNCNDNANYNSTPPSKRRRRNHNPNNHNRVYNLRRQIPPQIFLQNSSMSPVLAQLSPQIFQIYKEKCSININYCIDNNEFDKLKVIVGQILASLRNQEFIKQVFTPKILSRAIDRGNVNIILYLIFNFPSNLYSLDEELKSNLSKLCEKPYQEKYYLIDRICKKYHDDYLQVMRRTSNNNIKPPITIDYLQRHPLYKEIISTSEIMGRILIARKSNLSLANIKNLTEIDKLIFSAAAKRGRKLYT